jgi:preprotein translocase subunit SecA
MEKQPLLVLTVDAETGEQLERELNADELAELKNAQAESKAREAERKAKAAARASALAKLSELGLTEAEVSAL